ncbi:hypothetical protein AGLY_009151 [Aphis glycines]|uniref:WW domain-containing protein n=1 Tax=Aphis glycines TaxID=307491 RepID=A0A6G0TIK3_APHGL|nr:hypothetical protein AGLY_009151 [Aphis glycines]
MAVATKSNWKFGSGSDSYDGDDEYDTQLQTEAEHFNEIIIKQEYSEEIEITTELNETYSDDDLPGGWEKIDHDSGMPVYINTETRVCSFSKPYFLGIDSLENHEIPVANVPCLNQKLNNETNTASTSTDSTSNKCPVTLSHEEYQNYCSKVFKFRNIKCYKFNSWVKRREYIKKLKANLKTKDLQQSTSSTSDCVVKNEDKIFSMDDLQHFINLRSKNFIGLLVEYLQRELKTSNYSFEIKELEHSKYPYLSTAVIDGIQYGVGTGSTKKQAKTDSARATLHILLPYFKHFQTNKNHQANNKIKEDLEKYKIFDILKITDSRILDICVQSTESTPYEMLKLCIKKNFGENSNLLYEMEQIHCGSGTDSYYRCTMTVNKYSATVICKDKLGGRQKGAQALLKVLHPHVQFFGSLLRLYSHQHFEYNENKPIKPKTFETDKYRSRPHVNLLKTLRKNMLKLELETNE